MNAQCLFTPFSFPLRVVVFGTVSVDVNLVLDCGCAAERVSRPPLCHTTWPKPMWGLICDIIGQASLTNRSTIELVCRLVNRVVYRQRSTQDVLVVKVFVS